jgi:chromosome segregation ATPase
MTIEVITNLITNIGFPIAICIALGYFVYKLWQQSVKREETLMKEIAENRVVNEKAIETIAQYAERLTHIEGSIEHIQNDVVLIKEKI